MFFRPREKKATEIVAEKPLNWQRRLTIMILLFGGISVVYLVVGLFAVESETLWDASVDFDYRIPRSAPWLVVYFFYYFQILAPASAVKDERVLLRMCAAYGVIFVVAVPLWIWLPVTVERDPVPIGDFWTYALNILRWKDPPVNCLPSMHVAHAAIAALVVWRVDRKFGTLMCLSVGMIWWSSLTVGQHWILDGVLGLAIALLADWLVFDVYKPLPKSAFSRIERKWHLVWIGFFVIGVILVYCAYMWGWLAEEALSATLKI